LKRNILVTGIGGGGNGEQIIKSLKLSKLDIKIVGTNITSNTMYLNDVDKFYSVPSANDIKYKESIITVIKNENIDFIFTGSETELLFWSNNRESLKSIGVRHPFNSNEIIELCLNKYNMFRQLELLHINIPKFNKIDQIEDINCVDYFPVILKPNTNSGGSSDVYIAFNKIELEMFSRHLLNKNVDVIVQEYLPFNDNEYTIGVSNKDNGEYVGSILLKRDFSSGLSVRNKFTKGGKKYIISSGVSQGEILHSKDIEKQAKRISKALNSVGPLNIQCRYINGELMVMEINPRISGTAALRALAGYNEVEEMIKYYVNNKPWNFSYKDIYVARGLSEEII